MNVKVIPVAKSVLMCMGPISAIVVGDISLVMWMGSPVKILMNVPCQLEDISVPFDAVTFQGVSSALALLLVINWHQMHGIAKILMSVLLKHIPVQTMRPALTFREVFVVFLWNVRRIIANLEILSDRRRQILSVALSHVD